MKLKKYRIISTKIERILWAIWKKGIVPINNVLNRKIFFSRHGVFFKRGRQVLQGAGCRWREAFCGVYAAKDGETQQRKAAARIVQHWQSAAKERAEEGTNSLPKGKKREICGDLGKCWSLFHGFSPGSYILNRKKYSTTAKKYATIKHNSDRQPVWTDKENERAFACRGKNRKTGRGNALLRERHAGSAGWRQRPGGFSLGQTGPWNTEE